MVYPNGNGVSGFARLASEDVIISPMFRLQTIMEFFSSAVTILQTLVVAIGARLGVWGVINLMEGYGNDNPGANAHVP